MRRAIHILTAICVMTMGVSCDSSTQDPDAPADGYLLSVDKTVIEADGVDMAVFSIKDQSGKTLSVDAEMGFVYYEDARTGRRLARRSKGFSSLDNGEYEFYGIYRGTYTSNTVKIKAVNRERYEKFHRNVAVFKLTGAWCPACPGMTDALHALDESVSSHIVVMACHYNDVFSDIGVGASISSMFNNNAYPANVYDLCLLDGSVTGIADIVYERRLDSPATCGIAVSECSFDAGVLTVRASLLSDGGGAYDLACAVLKDNNYIAYDGRTSYSPDGYYHDVVCAVSENFLGFRTASSVTLDSDEEAEKVFEFNVGDASSFLNDLKVVVFAHRKSPGGETSVDNAVLCRYGDTVGYIYNK